MPDYKIFSGVYDLLCALGDWKSYLKKVKDNGGTGVRIFMDCNWHWEGTQPYLPAEYNEEIAENIRHKDPLDEKDVQNDNGIMTLVRESGRRFPIFDYMKLNPVYWDHAQEVLEYCKELGLIVWCVMVDYCTWKTEGDDKYYSCWYSAVQRMLPGVQDGCWGSQMRPWVGRFYQQVWEKLILKTKVDFLIEDMNEGDALDMSDSFMLDWFKWSNEFLKAIGVPESKLVTTVSRNIPEIAKLCKYFSAHGIGRPDQIHGYWGIPLADTIFSTDGFNGGTGDPDGDGRRGLGVDDVPALAQALLYVGNKTLEELPRGVYFQNNDRATIDLFNPAVIRAMAIQFGWISDPLVSVEVCSATGFLPDDSFCFFTKIIQVPESELSIFPGCVLGMKHFAPSEAWEAETGVVYKYKLPQSGYVVRKVWMPRFISPYDYLIEYQSVAAVGANPGGWYFNQELNTVYVTALDLVKPQGGVVIFVKDYVPPVPPDPPTPPIPPVPTKPCSYWFWKLKLKRWWKCITGK